MTENPVSRLAKCTIISCQAGNSALFNVRFTRSSVTKTEKTMAVKYFYAFFAFSSKFTIIEQLNFRASFVILFGQSEIITL